MNNIIVKFNKKHGGKYDYSKVEYVNAKTKVCIICTDHGEFWQTPSSHLYNDGCQKCGNFNKGNTRRKNILKNKFEGLIQPDDYKLVPLSKGKLTKVDNEDFDKLRVDIWSLSRDYANSKKYGLMHRFILNCPEDMWVDHINGDTLDNRKVNLRLCTPLDNARNRVVHKDSSSGIKGVWFNKKTKRWIAEIKRDSGKYIGSFDTAEEAGFAYDKEAQKLHGEFAKLNNLPKHR